MSTATFSRGERLLICPRSGSRTRTHGSLAGGGGGARGTRRVARGIQPKRSRPTAARFPERGGVNPGRKDSALVRGGGLRRADRRMSRPYEQKGSVTQAGDSRRA